MYNMCVITSLISVLLICVGINANTTKHNVEIDTDLSSEEVSGPETDHNGQDNKLFITTLNTILGNHENSTNDTFIVAKSTPYTLHVYKSINTTELTPTPPKSLNDIDDDIMTRKVLPPKFLTKKIQRTTIKPVAKFEAVINDVHQQSTKSKKFMKVTTTPKNINKKAKSKEQTGKSKKVVHNLKDVKFETNLTSCTLQKNGRNKIRSAIGTNSTLSKPLCARPKNVNQNVKPKKPRNTNENLAKKPRSTNENLANRKPKQTTKPPSKTANNAKHSGPKNKTKRSENARPKTKRAGRKIKNNRSKIPPRPKPDNKNKKAAKTDKKKLIKTDKKKTKQNKEQKTKADNSKKIKRVVKPTSSPSPPTLRSSPTSPSPPSSTSTLSPPSPIDKEPWLYTGKISDLVKKIFFN